MKRIHKILVASSAFTLVCLFNNFAAINAQTQSKPTLATPTPTVKPTPKTDDDEIIRVDSELVNLNVRVVDRSNRSINDVQQKDFKIYEDGVLQQIDFFSRSDVPTNYALVVDNSGSIAPQLEKVIEAGNILVNTNRPDDETMVIRFVGRERIEVLQQFTSNKPDLLDSLDQFMKEGGQTAIIDAVYLAVESVEEYEKAKNANDRKRRAIVLITDGEDRDSFYTEKQLFDLLRESETQIYVVGFIGDLSKEGGFIGKSPQGKAKAFLERISTETGGKAYFPSSNTELPGLAREISTELRTQYSIGYIPSNDKNDGTFRNIKVVVDEGPNKQKRIAVSRTGRVAEGGTPASAQTKITPATKKP